MILTIIVSIVFFHQQLSIVGECNMQVSCAVDVPKKEQCRVFGLRGGEGEFDVDAIKVEYLVALEVIDHTGVPLEGGANVIVANIATIAGAIAITIEQPIGPVFRADASVLARHLIAQHLAARLHIGHVARVQLGRDSARVDQRAAQHQTLDAANKARNRRDVVFTLHPAHKQLMAFGLIRVSQPHHPPAFAIVQQLGRLDETHRVWHEHRLAVDNEHRSILVVAIDFHLDGVATGEKGSHPNRSGDDLAIVIVGEHNFVAVLDVQLHKVAVRVVRVEQKSVGSMRTKADDNVLLQDGLDLTVLADRMMYRGGALEGDCILVYVHLAIASTVCDWVGTLALVRAPQLRANATVLAEIHTTIRPTARLDVGLAIVEISMQIDHLVPEHQATQAADEAERNL